MRHDHACPQAGCKKNNGPSTIGPVRESGKYRRHMAKVARQQKAKKDNEAYYQAGSEWHRPR